MKKSLFILMAFSLWISFLSPVQAETLYITGQAGFSKQPTSDNENPNNPVNSFELDTQMGVNAALAAGAKFGDLRGEVELVYRYNENNKFNLGGTNQGADGDLSMMLAFLNVYYEIDIFGVVTPYVGAGFGYGTVTLDLKELDGTVVADDNDTVYSYQLMAGAAVNVSESWSITAEYRYFDTITDAELTLEGGLGYVENKDISAQEIRFGLRYWLF